MIRPQPWILTSALLSLLAVTACRKERDKTAEGAITAVEDGAVDEPQSEDALPPKDEEVVSLFKACKEAGKDAGVTSIAEVIDLINLLPKPVSIPCFLAALPRTYTLTAAESQASAQPASRDQPRFFLALGALFVTVTGDGTGKDHVELSEFDGRRQSIKGDLLFPIEGDLEATAPFAFKTEGQESSCAACHGGEKGGPKDTRDATLSDALRPAPDALLSADELNGIKAACETGVDAHCQLVRAIFFDSAPETFLFPESMRLLSGRPPKAPQE